ncbi:MAG TPA: deoxyguanosinetriphosphate triphosphohydrolase [Candidatus Aphodomorpha intestinavium]|uniref:Deoxyguanosinetriphosphate triphosphohydrolase-like protein n=1 Tax=Candidatus Aphodomorpha intestinavium TaxID=2840672 RepID=A0A9D1N4D9_9FIRM|nr:deoxyguanosinetriphosphate triphosphohydrolase [Candidatus Aphodomorpha intestinavium]
MTGREYAEQLEADTLSPYAALSRNSRGREHPITPCALRTEFIRDRDRILHCKSFRRPKHKTQVFLAPQGDHYRTRLTHTLEVAQIARTISRALRLNEDLTEAIALGHDLGHTPFGHSGEDVLAQLVPGGFEHNVQSLRVVRFLENGGQGLNLTFEVRDGILHHKRSGTPATLEGKVVSVADRIAYLNHDIDDAIRAGVIAEADLPADCVRTLGDSHGRRINTIILDIVAMSEGRPAIAMSAGVNEQFELLRAFMFERVYKNPVAKREEGKAKRMVEQLYLHYCAHLEEIPPEFLLRLDEDGRERVAADYIACMTDNYAINDFERLFVPKSWA